MCRQKKYPVANRRFQLLGRTVCRLGNTSVSGTGIRKSFPPTKELIYYLTEAALQGRDILFDQNGKWNLPIRRTLEAVYTQYKGDKESSDFKALEKYLKQVWFANGIHHHYSTDKFTPEFSQTFFEEAVRSLPSEILPLQKNGNIEQLLANICPVIFDPDTLSKRVNLTAGEDLIATSASNYYDGVTQNEAETFYAALKTPGDTMPVSYGLNSRLVKREGKIYEEVNRLGGHYGAAIEKSFIGSKKPRR